MLLFSSLKHDIKSLVVFIHNSLEDIGIQHILQAIDFDALPDGDELDAFLGDWLKQFSPEFAVSFRLFPETGISQVPPSFFFFVLFFFLTLWGCFRLSNQTLLSPHLCFWLTDNRNAGC